MHKTEQHRLRIAACCVAAITLISAPSFGLSARLFVWNPTASVPRGLYMRVQSPITRGAFVLAWLPKSARRLADERGYLPAAVPALKPVAAVAGDVVCSDAERIVINRTVVAERRFHDRQGREMPRWHGCETLTEHQVFLLSTFASDSFDGRYFGPSSISDIIEKVMPVWTFP